MSSTMKLNGTALMSNFVTVLFTTRLYTLNCTGTSFVFTFVVKNGAGKGRSAVTTNLAGLFFLCNDGLANYMVGTNSSNSALTINCEGLVLHTTSIYLRSPTAVFFAPDHKTPSVNSVIYNSTPPRSMAGTSENSVLYILDTLDNLISIRSSVVKTFPILTIPRISVGSSLQSPVSSVPFGDTLNKITGASLITGASTLNTVYRVQTNLNFSQNTENTIMIMQFFKLGKSFRSVLY